MKQYDEFITAFRLLGEDWELNAELIVALENFVCHLYRYNHPDINKVRQKIFVKKFVKEEKVIVTTFPVQEILVDEDFNEGSIKLELYPQNNYNDENIDD